MTAYWAGGREPGGAAQVDLDARLAFMRLRGFREGRRSCLENSLVYRLMQVSE